jgi:predicted transcriptional regulator
MIDATLARTLEHVGFDEKEARTYLALLELGQGAVSEVAERAGLKRAIVYHVIERLKKRGFVHDSEEGAKVKRFAAAEPAKVLQNAATALDDFKFMFPVMRALQNKGRHKPRIEFFETKEAIGSVYRLYEKGKDIRYLESIGRINEVIPDEVRAWIGRHESGAVTSKARHFLPDNVEEHKWATRLAPYGQQIRFLPKGVDIDTDFAIVDDYLGITSFDPLFVVVIRSDKIAKSAAALFDLAWKQGRPFGDR